VGLLNRLPAPGAVFAGFLLEAEIGRGGAGAVFRARSPEGELYALKILLRDLSQDRQRIRFEREALAGQQLRHPGVIAVYGAGVEQGLGFMVMELLTGALPLDEYVAEHSLDLASRVRLLSEIATAVHAAHQAKLIHRDLKPDNVLVTPDGKPKVVDFGLARHVERERLTQSGATMGTLFYMAPEQIRGQTAHADARTDVYALGVMLYQLLTGKLPFTGDTAIEIMRAALESEPPPLPPEVSGMEPVIRLAMAKEPDQRYASAADFARDLQATESSQGTAASGVLAARKRQRATLVLAVTLPVAAALVALSVYLFSPTALPEEELRRTLLALKADTSPLASSAHLIEDLPERTSTASLDRELAGWRALLAAARRERAESIPPDTPFAWAISGARGGEDAERDLSRAIRSGLARADLHRWRALAADPKRDARQILSDAERWRVQADLLPGDLDPRLAAAMARAWLHQGDLKRASELVHPESPRDLRWELGLARATERLLRDAPAAWKALAPLVEEPPPPTCVERARALGRRAGVELRLRLQSGVKSEPEARAFLLLWRRLAPDSPVPREVRAALLSEVNGIKGPVRLELALAAGDVFPDDVELQRGLVGAAGRLRKGAQRRLFPAIRRAIALEVEPDERLKHQLVFAYLLAHVGEMNKTEAQELERLVATVLPEVEDDEFKAILLSARGRQHLDRGDLHAAEVDLRDAVQLDPAFAVARFMLAKLFQDTKQHQLALEQYLVYLRGNERNGGRREDSLRYAWSQRPHPLAVKAIEAYLRGDPDHGGWQLRYVSLVVREAPLASLRKRCELGADLLGKSDDPALLELASEAQGVLNLLESDQNRGPAAERLRGIVTRLERRRKEKAFP
jgi:tRNA A-37 threonylcarbamoyl transferase component Bud32